MDAISEYIAGNPNPLVRFTYKKIQPWKDETSGIERRIIFGVLVFASHLASIVDAIASLFFMIVTYPLKLAGWSTLSTGFLLRFHCHLALKQEVLANLPELLIQEQLNAHLEELHLEELP